MSRVHTMKQGSWAAIEYVAYPAVMFLVAPYFIYLLGTDRYGQWMLLIALSSLGGLAGLGMGAATTKEISEQIGLNQNSKLRITIGASLSIAILGGTLFGILLLAVYFSAPESWFSKLGIRGDTTIIFICAAVIILLEQCESIYVGAMRGFERFDLGARIDVIIKIASVAVYLTCAWLYQDIFILFYMAVAATSLRLLAKSLAVSWLVGGLIIRPQLSLPVTKRLLKFGKWAWIQALSASIFAASDRLLIGSLLGAEPLARFSLMMQLAQQVHAIPSASAAVIFPLISRKRASGESIAKVVWTSLIVISLIVIILAVPMMIFSATILEEWVPTVVMPGDDRILVLLIIAFGILGINIVTHYCLMGLGHIKSIALTNLLAGIMSISVCAITLQTDGLIAGAWAKLAYAVILSIIFILIVVFVFIPSIRKSSIYVGTK